MRKIKFRAWNETKSIMFYPFKEITVDIDEGHVSLCLFQGLSPHDIKYRDDDFILLEYAGLKDRNGKEIYEGDIIKCEVDERIAEVSFENGCFWYEDKKGNYGELHNVLTSNLEVIGNTYANKDLL